MVAMLPMLTMNENHDNQKEEKPSSLGQVVIYESGKALLKVETGTTVEVMKLLYEAENKNFDSANIIGVRPRNSSDIPCIVTLDESKLDDVAYDLIVKDKKSTTSPVSSDVSSNGYATPHERNERSVTTRCIDCSRESWKTKRYTSVGMNTEISINPLLEIDSLRSMSASSSYQTAQQPNTETTYQSRPRGRPSIQRPVPIPPPGNIVYSSVHKKDYVVAALPAVPNCVTDIEYMDRINYRSRSPRTSPIPHIHSGGHTKICYPPMSKTIDLDTVHYENFRHRHPPQLHSPNHHMVLEAEGGQMSPRRRARSRSPVIHHGNGYIKAEDAFHHHSHKPDERRHIYHSEYVRVATQYPYEHVPTVAAFPTHHPEPESEPPVYVLPNDFDMKRDRIDQHIMSYEQAKEYQPNQRDISENGPKQVAVGAERTSPDASDSGKSGTDETSTAEVSNVRTLSCKICKQTFPTKSTLYKHLRGHTSDEKPFKCHECGQGFTLSSNLRQHRIIHRGYKPFQCEYCGKKFMRSNVYKQHRRIHTGEKMHKCDLCPSEFLQKYALTKHMKKVHNIETFDN